MQPTIREYEDYLRSDGKAEKTIQSYLSDIRTFITFLEGINVNYTQLQRQHIVTYRQHLLNKNYRPASINKAINSLNNYTNWLIKNRIVAAQMPLVRPAQDRIKIANGSEEPVDVLNEPEVEILLNYTSRPDVSQRDRLIIHFLLYTGTRVGELCNIKISDLDLLTGQVRIIGKGSKYREIPLRPDLVELIQIYLRNSRANIKHFSSPYLLISQRADFLNRDSVNTILEKIGKATGIHLYPHKFRHTFCTRLIAAGVPITTVSKLAGHSGVDTTARFYVNISREEKQSAVNLL